MESSKRIKLSLSKKLKEYANKMGRDHLGGDDIPGNKKKGGLRDFDGYDNVQYNRDMPMDEDSPESAHPQGSKKLSGRTTVMDMLDVISHKEFGPDYHKLSTKQKKEVHKLAIKGKLIKQSPFKESVNELLVIVDKFDKRKQDYGKIYYKDGGRGPGDGDINKAKKEFAKLSKKHKGLTLVSVGRNSKMYDVMDESVNEAGKLAMGIAALTGTRGSAVQDFIDKNRINDKKLFKALKSANLQGRINFASALSGKPNNPNARLTKKLFGESKKEVIAFRKKAKSETAFYDILDKIERKYGRGVFEKWLDKSLKDLKLNPKKYKTSADKQEALYQAKL